MAILLDLNQIVISGLQSQVRACRINVLDKDLCRHLVLNSIRAVVHKFKAEYGEVIVCCDSRKYWRKEVFPHYKASRKKAREKSDLDWNVIFEVLDEVRADLKAVFPYKVIDVERAEADDVIGTLTPRLAAHESVMICSSDGDFKQLHQYSNVKQYNPMLGIYVKSENPQLELKEKISAVDENVRELWDAMDSEQQKSLKSEFFILNRYISNAKTSDRDIQRHFVLTVNEYFNKNLSYNYFFGMKIFLTIFLDQMKSNLVNSIYHHLIFLLL
jgi:hypothetical protein